MRNAEDEINDVLDGFDEGDLSDEDYGFVISPDGELKSFFVPVDDFNIDPPQAVVDILRLFGIDDVSGALEGNNTIH